MIFFFFFPIRGQSREGDSRITYDQPRAGVVSEHGRGSLRGIEGRASLPGPYAYGPGRGVCRTRCNQRGPPPDFAKSSGLHTTYNRQLPGSAFGLVIIRSLQICKLTLTKIIKKAWIKHHGEKNRKH